MSKEQIDLCENMSFQQFRSLTEEMLKAKKAYEELKEHDGREKSKGEFVKKEYIITKNRDAFEEGFTEKLNKDAEKGVLLAALFWRTLVLIAYVVFFVECTKIPGMNVEGAWCFIVPLSLLVIYSALRLCLKIDALGCLLTGIGLVGLYFPASAIFAFFSETDTISKGDITCLIAYFIAIIPAVVFPFFVSHKFFARKLKGNRKYRKEYDKGIGDAALKDKKLSEQQRQADEKQYQKYLDTRENLLPQKDEIEVEWKRYEEFYSAWCDVVSHIKLWYPKAAKDYNDDDELIFQLHHVYSDDPGTAYDFFRMIKNDAKELHERIERSIELADEVAKEFSDLLNRIH
ncbi:MAG: hypothetical protein IJY20_08285 [Clostridia bacterium]|nr:hypothetical protein [Clostridia bacterium]